MSRKKNYQSWQAARIINDELALPKEKWCNYSYQDVNFGYYVAIDDDPKSVIYASRIINQTENLNAWKYLLCVGGNGLLSKHYKTTEGKRLASIASEKCDIPNEKIRVLDNGSNTGENIAEIAQFIAFNENHHLDEEYERPVMFILTKRLSLRFERSLKKQAPELYKVSFFFVIDETLDEACTWYNCKMLGNGKMAFHELASILPRCEEYSRPGPNNFQEPIDFDIPKHVYEAADYLARRYRLKLPRSFWQEPKALLQYISLKIDMLKHLDDMEHELDEDIKWI